MDKLLAEAQTEGSGLQVLLSGKPKVILAAENPATLANLEDLARSCHKPFLATPDIPVGKDARQALDQMDSAFGSVFETRVPANIVSNEDDFKQVVGKVQLGESDADAAPKSMSIEIPQMFKVATSHEIAPLGASHNADLAAQSVGCVLSHAAQSVLIKWGFGPIP
jgi:ABC-type molybdate transport system substrate-binding protein